VDVAPQPPARSPAAHAATFAMRGVSARPEVAMAAADLCAAVLASALGLRTRVAVRMLREEEGGAFAFDLHAGRERPRGGHAPHAVRVLAVDDARVLERGNALLRLAGGGLVALPTGQRSADALWAEVPAWAKAIVFDRGARVVGWSPVLVADSPWPLAAGFAGLALAEASTERSLAGARAIDAATVEREVSEALGHAGADAAALAADCARAARAAFEARIEVPRATIDREDDGVRLGRRDARAPAER
jgi:hypothetical protein